MFDLNNPDWTKDDIPECRQCLFPQDLCVCGLGKDLKEMERRWKIKWNREHQYPHMSSAQSRKRIWVNPYYVSRGKFVDFWGYIAVNSTELENTVCPFCNAELELHHWLLRKLPEYDSNPKKYTIADIFKEITLWEDQVVRHNKCSWLYGKSGRLTI